jgi:uncharacterized protein
MIRAALWTACALVMVSGCSSGPAPRVFLLVAPLQSAASQTPAPDTPAVQVQTVTLPDYLDTEDILMRDSAHELQSSASGKWGERLSAGMTQALAAALVTRLPAYQLKPPRPTDRLARQILVDVAAFDVWRDGRCALSASWTILQPGATAVALNRREVFLTPSIKPTAVGDTAVVTAMAATIDQLADAIARDMATPAALVSSEHP